MVETRRIPSLSGSAHFDCLLKLQAEGSSLPPSLAPSHWVLTPTRRRDLCPQLQRGRSSRRRHREWPRLRLFLNFRPTAKVTWGEAGRKVQSLLPHTKYGNQYDEHAACPVPAIGARASHVEDLLRRADGLLRKASSMLPTPLNGARPI